MTDKPSDDWSDERLVERLKSAAIEQFDCSLDMERANRIDSKEIVPCADLLASRGPEAVRKLLPLLRDENPNVRLIAASCTFDLDPIVCRQVLHDLVRAGGILRLFAWAVWSRHDPGTAPDPTAFAKAE
jgi:Domain of unknown function (DUF2019)